MDCGDFADERKAYRDFIKSSVRAIRPVDQWRAI